MHEIELTIFPSKKLEGNFPSGHLLNLWHAEHWEYFETFYVKILIKFNVSKLRD